MNAQKIGPKTNKLFDAIIIGAGASGVFCAQAAALRGRKIAVLDHNDQALKKVKISGGGRCNFTNLNASAKNYVSENSHFAISALQQFSAHDLLDFLEKQSLSFQEKAPGQLFCANSSQEIINVLNKKSKAASFFFSIKIKSVTHENNFIISTSLGEFEAPSLVIATGGASYSVLGASEFGYQLAKQFGHKIIPFKPALVPFNLDNELMKKTIKLKGIALPAKVSCGEFEVVEQILFTHFGLSGPAILQASLYWSKNQPVEIDLLPQQNAAEFLLQQKRNNIKKKISSLLKAFFPDRIIEFLLEEQDQFIAEIADKKIQEIGKRINHWQIVPIGTQGFKLAEVTKGGVDVNEISSKTFESCKINGLYFIGEVLDVTGQLGGFNLQWAWSSGWVCGQQI